MTVVVMAVAATTARTTPEDSAMKRILILSCAVLLGAGAALAAPAMVGKTAKGDVLVDAKGMTLYTFDKDSKDASACEGPCATNWPPLAAAKGAKAENGFSAFARPDGSMQWAHQGKPLYTWANDAKPGDITGDGVKGVWHLARP